MLFEPVFAALDRRGVRFLVAGGTAAELHGHAHLSPDLDLIIEPADGKAAEAIEALLELGLQSGVPVDPLKFADRATRQQWIRERGLVALPLRDPDNPPLEVDLFADPPDDFEELWTRAAVFTVGDTRVRVVTLDDLIAMKRVAARLKDLADVEQLQRLRDVRPDNA